jgi:hypothetical protein
MRFVTYLSISLACLLTACGGNSTSFMRPRVPALPAEAAMPCPALAPIPDPSMGALAIAHGETVAAYAECQKRHGAAVAAYGAARTAINGESD